MATAKLTDEHVLNLIDCAGTGIGYWAASGEVDPEAKTYRVIESDEQPAGDTPVDKTLSFDEIRAAFNKLARDGQLPDWQMREIKENDLGFDAMVGDMTIQQAVFGEIIFG